MASNDAFVNWTANTESDLAGYKIYYGQQPGIFSTSVSQVSTAPVGVILSAGSFDNDGTWYFAVSAFDTSNNESAVSTPTVSKRVVRTASKLVVRR